MVTNYGGDSVSVIDTGTWRVVQTVPGVNEPFAITVDSADADRAYVSTVSPAYDSVTIVDVPTNTIVATHPLALSVSDLVVSPDGKYVYATRNGARAADVVVLDTTSGEVQVIDIAEVCKARDTSTQCVRINSGGDRLYVGTNGPEGGRVVVIGTHGQSGGRTSWRRKNTKGSARSRGKGEQPVAKSELSVAEIIEIGLPIRDVALSPDGAIAYVASCGPDIGAVVDVIDTRTNKITHTRKITEIGGLLTGLTISGDGDRAYLVSDDSITVLCTLTHDVVGTIRVAMQPSCAVESPDGKYLYIADYAGAVTVAPVATFMSSIESSDDPAEWAIPELMQYEAALV
jgi:YVTN family beta-propeller protein